MKPSRSLDGWRQYTNVDPSQWFGYGWGETTGTFGWGDLDPVGQVTVGEQHRYPLTP